MADLLYNFLDNNFTVYEPVPEVTKNSILNTPLGDVDVSDWGYINPNGAIVANDNIETVKEESPRFIVNNNEEYTPVTINDNELTSSDNELTSDNKSYKKATIGNRILEAKQFFIDKGLTDYLAAGIIGNLMWESGDNTLLKTDIKGDNGKSFGMAQWNKDAGRWLALERFAKSKNSHISDFYTQLEFIWKELLDNPRWLKSLKNTKDFREATNSFMINFENPKRSVANLRQRTIYAELVWKQN